MTIFSLSLRVVLLHHTHTHTLSFFIEILGCWPDEWKCGTVRAKRTQVYLGGVGSGHIGAKNFPLCGVLTRYWRVPEWECISRVLDNWHDRMLARLTWAFTCWYNFKISFFYNKNNPNQIHKHSLNQLFLWHLRVTAEPSINIVVHFFADFSWIVII